MEEEGGRFKTRGDWGQETCREDTDQGTEKYRVRDGEDEEKEQTLGTQTEDDDKNRQDMEMRAGEGSEG